MEKRRRARINNCLNEIKTLMLQATKKDVSEPNPPPSLASLAGALRQSIILNLVGFELTLTYQNPSLSSDPQPARHSKLEKADILEMTVKYLQNHQLNLQRQQAALSQATDATIASKFKSGFTECANEVGRFQGMDPQVKRRLLQHLSNCINGDRLEQHVHLLPSPPSSPEQDSMSHVTATPNGYYLTNGAGSGVQLIPTKLPNGNIAFVLPQSPAASQVPMLVPIPSRTASTSSATSSAYERMREQSTSPYNAPPSPANSSYEPMDCLPAHQSKLNMHQQQQLNLLHQQQLMQQRPFSPSVPISLVMRKTNFDQQIKDEEKPWRPW